MNKKIPGIKSKLFTYLLSFCVLLLIILALFQTVFLDRFYISIKQGQIDREIIAISSYIKSDDKASLESLVYNSDGIFIEIWSLDKELILSSDNFQKDIHTQLNPREMEQLILQLETTDGSITRKYQDKDKFSKGMRERLVSAQLVELPDGNARIVLVSAGLSPVKATVETLRIQLLYISGIMLLLSVGLALLISKKIATPLVSISQTANELREGNYNVVFRGSGYQEVVQLADILTDAASELSKTETLRRELISNVSHDLRTPLTLIGGYSEMIRDMPSEMTGENMQVIIDETKRLTTLVDDLLDLSKLQSGTQKIVMEEFDLEELLSEIVGRVSRFYEKDGYSILYDPVDPILVNGDRERISQVIYNFILNSIGHTGVDKKVTVRLVREENGPRLEVTDYGEGILEEDLPYIWDRYYKVDKTHHRSVSSSGLGLSIAKSIFDQHPNMNYGVDSQTGVGTTFWFTIKYS